MIKKFNGHLALPSGKLIECQGEIDEQPAPTNEEFLEKTKQGIRDIVEKFQIPKPIVVSLDGSYVPSGPVVDSTLAEKSEEEQ